MRHSPAAALALLLAVGATGGCAHGRIALRAASTAPPAVSARRIAAAPVPSGDAARPVRVPWPEGVVAHRAPPRYGEVPTDPLPSYVSRVTSEGMCRPLFGSGSGYTETQPCDGSRASGGDWAPLFTIPAFARTP